MDGYEISSYNVQHDQRLKWPITSMHPLAFHYKGILTEIIGSLPGFRSIRGTG